jgi:carboxymethylenebutenolidase
VGEIHDIAAKGGVMRGYFALPKAPNGSGIVLGSSIWGVNSDLRAIADGYASLGYAVVAPNLFWRKASVDGTEYDLAQFETVVQFANTGSDTESIDDMRRAKADLVRRAGCSRVAAIGWCYGGRIACLEAATDTYDLCIGVYPTYIDKHLDLAGRMMRPMMLHLAENEKYTSIEDSVSRVVATFKDNPLVRSYVYPGAAHGFDFAPPHPHSDHAAARLCDIRMALALDRVLVRGAAL